MRSPSRHFKPDPYAYHQEIELEIETLTNLGLGLGRDQGWVVMVPFTLPGERVRARIYKNLSNYSEADCLDILKPSPERLGPPCPLFGTCGGCQYQHLSYPAQLEWKRQQVVELMARIGGFEATVLPTHPSPKTYGYRSKLTPHYGKPPKDVGLGAPGSNTMPIGFQHRGRRGAVVDVPQCPIATDAINAALPEARKAVWQRAKKLKKGGTVLLRDTQQGVVTDNTALVTERVGGLTYQVSFFKTTHSFCLSLCRQLLSRLVPGRLIFLWMRTAALACSPWPRQIASSRCMALKSAQKPSRLQMSMRGSTVCKTPVF